MHNTMHNTTNNTMNNNMFQKYKSFICSIWNIIGIYMIWIVIHYTASHMYTAYCTPYTFIGFLVSPFIVSTPHCTGLRWCISQGAHTLTAMWIVSGTWIAAKLGGLSIC